jgi:hypothetical protein
VPTLRTARRRRVVLAFVATVLLTSLAAIPVAAADGVPPSVVATTPADGATDVAPNATVSVTFSEPVDVSGNWFRVECDQSSNHLSAASGGPTTWSIDPINDFIAGEACTLTIVASNVTDQDEATPMAGDAVATFTIGTGSTGGGGGTGTATFDGFRKPLRALPAVNRSRAGSSIPVRFGLSAAESFTAASEAFACGTTPPSTATEPAVQPGHRAVGHDRHGDTYTFVWKTSKAWKHTCRVFVLTLDDGSTQSLAFRFR